MEKFGVGACKLLDYLKFNRHNLIWYVYGIYTHAWCTLHASHIYILDMICISNIYIYFIVPSPCIYIYILFVKLLLHLQDEFLGCHCLARLSALQLNNCRAWISLCCDKICQNGIEPQLKVAGLSRHGLGRYHYRSSSSESEPHTLLKMMKICPPPSPYKPP